MKFNVRKPKTFKRKVKKIVKKVTNNNIRTIVKKEIKRSSEIKHTNNDPSFYLWGTDNSTLSPAIDLHDALTIAQGTTDGTRVGNKINVTKAILNMNFNSTASLLIVSVYVGYRKGNKGTNPSASLGVFLQDGVGTSPFNNSTLSLLRNINKDIFVVTAMTRFKLANTAQDEFGNFVNKKLNLKPMLGSVSYNDSTAQSVNKQLYMWATVTQTNSGLVTNVNFPVFQYYIDIEYTDN